MKERKTPMRRCIGCNTSKDKRELIRIAAYDDKLTLDPTGKAKGRGVYICPDTGCLEAAFKKNGFRRSLKRDIKQEEIEKLEQELRIYLDGSEES